MKKVFLFVALIGMVFVSCSKDEEDPIFDIEKAYGVWEVVGGDDFTACPDGDNKIVEITATQIKEGQTTDEGCDNGMTVSLDYEYINGNTFDAGIGTYKITKLTDTELTFVMESPLAPGVSMSMNMEKVQ